METIIGQVLKCKCPRCRQGDMFVEKNPYRLRSIQKMHEHCPVCGQPMTIEVGFYYGTGYVSYALSVGFSMLSFLAWWIFVGFGAEDNRLYYWLVSTCILLILLQPVLMRWSRSLWIAFFVPYDPDWQLHTAPPSPAEEVQQLS